MPTVLVIGAGAIGGFYGAFLAEAGAEVSVVCRSDYETVKENGFMIQSPLGNRVFKPKKVMKAPAGQYDYVLVTTKTTVDSTPLLKSVLTPSTAIVLLQNGIFIEEPVRQAFPNHEIISGVAFVGLTRIAPGVIQHGGFGRLAFGLATEKARRLSKLFESAGIKSMATDQIQEVRWKKLVWNAAFSPISVTRGGLSTQQILERPELRQLVRDVMAEVCALAKADGCPLPGDVIDKNISDTETMGHYKTSMLMDFAAHRPMEIEAILGNAVRFAHSQHIPISHLETLYASLVQHL